MVSPYLLKPVRALEDVLSASDARRAAREAAARSVGPERMSGTAAASLRHQGRIARPRVVWVNEAADSAPGRKPRKKS